MRLEKPEGDVTVALLFIIWLSKSNVAQYLHVKTCRGTRLSSSL